MAYATLCRAASAARAEGRYRQAARLYAGVARRAPNDRAALFAEAMARECA